MDGRLFAAKYQKLSDRNVRRLVSWIQIIWYHPHYMQYQPSHVTLVCDDDIHQTTIDKENIDISDSDTLSCR